MFGFAKRFWSFGFWSYDLGIGRTVTASLLLLLSPMTQKSFFGSERKKKRGLRLILVKSNTGLFFVIVIYEKFFGEILGPCRANNFFFKYYFLF